mmetsp:Transcript_68676/g.222665  ORF Transcript_68676/g.222665 Transcript_68676/m.222665 type:complete len:206 (+) Transcript_68676:149-766(+)
MAAPCRLPPRAPTVDVDFGRTTSGSPWKRSVSAGDLVKQRRGPNRRPFDSANHPEELVSPTSAIARLSDQPAHLADPSKRVSIGRFRARSDMETTQDPSSPMSATSSAFGARQERALDCWQLGESCRIMHHIAPKKYRNISLHGEVYQGMWTTDWKDVGHMKELRNRYHVEARQEIMRNRGFDKSHGSQRMPLGLMRVGSLLMIP